MFRYFHNNKAQATFGEYALVLILVISVMTGMGIYFRRAVQGRVRDARDYMVQTVYDRTRGYYNGNEGKIYYEYEPYYANTDSLIYRGSISQSNLVGGGVTGIHRETVNDVTRADTFSTTAPPKDSD